MSDLRIGSLCSGYEGLGMGVQDALGGRVAWVSDIDAGANKILAHHYPDAPNLGDFTVIDWATVEPVEVLTAGFPCQPVSTAGKRRGDLDERWLWDDVTHAIRSLRPRLVFLENVRGLFTAGRGRLFGRVLGALADLGYDAQWHGLRAAEVGAPHNRYRVFIAAYPAHDGLAWAGATRTGGAGLAHGDRGALTLLPTPAVNDMGRGKTVEDWDAWTERMKAAHGNGNGHGKSLEIEAQRVETWGQYASAIQRWERVTRPAPHHLMVGTKGQQQLAPEFSEWMMGLPAGHVTDPAIGLTRAEQLKALGNGVVPQQATAALNFLLRTAALGGVA